MDQLITITAKQGQSLEQAVADTETLLGRRIALEDIETEDPGVWFASTDLPTGEWVNDQVDVVVEDPNDLD